MLCIICWFMVVKVIRKVFFVEMSCYIIWNEEKLYYLDVFMDFFIEEVLMKLNMFYECGMEVIVFCRDLIGLWVVGLKGECMYFKVGFCFGKNGYRYFVV